MTTFSQLARQRQCGLAYAALARQGYDRLTIEATLRLHRYTWREIGAASSQSGNGPWARARRAEQGMRPHPPRRGLDHAWRAK